MTGLAAGLSHWIAAGAYLVLAVSVLLVGRVSVLTSGLALASAVMATWAAFLAYGASTGEFYAITLSLGETLRGAAWLAFVSAIGLTGWAEERVNPARRLIIGLLAIVLLQLFLDLLPALGIGFGGGGQFLSEMLRIVVAVGGVVLVHNVYVSSAPSNRWSLIALTLALVGIFAYDVNLFTFQLLDPIIGGDFFDARGIANAIVTPLFLIAVVRNRSLGVQLSRQAAIQTFALAAVGAYLIAMAASAYFLGYFGGEWSRLLQISFIFTALVLGALVLFSGRARAWARVKIAKHFFAYKYDYREEWLRFISTVGRSGPGFGTLEERVIEATANIVSSPGGALLELGEDATFQPVARWNFRTFDMRPLTFTPQALAAMKRDNHVLDPFAERVFATVDGVAPNDDAARPWLIVPLIHLDELIAVIALAHPRARRELDWEDYDILRIVGRQAASYVAEQSALSSLEETRKFEEFNRRFAFIMHDIKNLASQLGLLARNAERHADNPEFRADMVATLQSSVGRLQDLLVRLGEGGVDAREARQFDLREVVMGIVHGQTMSGAEVSLDADPYPLQVSGDPSRIEQAISHLVQNAVDAGEAGSPVVVRLRNEAGSITVLVEDRGSGMSPEFVREELFKPFRSTKSDGFGIGAYEARELLRAEGGRLNVVSEQGRGTTFIIRFPVVGPKSTTGEVAR